MPADSIFSHFNDDVLTSHDLTGAKHIQLKLPKGSGEAQLFSLLPGLELVFLDIQSFRYIPHVNHEENVIEINICYEGFAQCLTENSHLVETYRG